MRARLPMVAWLLVSLVVAEHGHGQAPWGSTAAGEAPLADPSASVVSIRYQVIEMAGLLDGSSAVDPEELVEGPGAPYVAAMTRLSTWKLIAMAQQAITPRLAIRATLPFINHTMSSITGPGGSFRLFAKGVGDLGLATSLAAVRRPHSRLMVELGASVPTGSISRTHTYRTPEGERPQLPYIMQPGAGVPGVRAALDFGHTTGSVHLGSRVAWTGFLGRNAREWAPGDRTMLTAWIALPLSPEWGVSVRGAVEQWGDVRGMDPSPTLPLSSMPAARPDLQGGVRSDLALGMSWMVHSGSGSRVAAEYILPVQQDLHGPQLARSWSIAVAAEFELHH